MVCGEDTTTGIDGEVRHPYLNFKGFDLALLREDVGESPSDNSAQEQHCQHQNLAHEHILALVLCKFLFLRSTELRPSRMTSSCRRCSRHGTVVLAAAVERGFRRLVATHVGI